MIIVVIVAAFVLPTVAQTYGSQNQRQYFAAPPTAGFRSTSTMKGSGSIYASNPSLESNGTASAPALGPNKAKKLADPINIGEDIPPVQEGEIVVDSPLGDALIPLMLMALIFIGITYLRRKRLNADS